MSQRRPCYASLPYKLAAVDRRDFALDYHPLRPDLYIRGKAGISSWGIELYKIAFPSIPHASVLQIKTLMAIFNRQLNSFKFKLHSLRTADVASLPPPRYNEQTSLMSEGRAQSGMRENEFPH